ncbi:trifunctional serine/threonine-protein kinase/ATP-binding protein/sensor histidine kinase [Pyxidicoccus sp. MSG2]|uniref:trifunctional serine/threonine-protein kinase/ATP-binding protein/sensor histidine kinase n=1 Tax=Pyxidicoccus sp. MSG2 TaxID=2996790 RepID=UPI002271479F|nr:ATP-binding sensor histidine kinase [Pyxidicoccus sp. MSG2]MCY1022299.1 AAA family ATPase [Pyxidicoccus sp. MSG2]
MHVIPGFTVAEVLAEDSTVLLRAKRSDGQSVLLRHFAKEYPSPEELARLGYGNELTSGLQLPGVVKSLGLTREGGRYVLVLEDSGGSPLTSLLAEGPMEPLEAIGIITQISRTLGELHRNRVIHKSIQPAHILYNRRTGEAKLTHFDFASRLDRETQVLRSIHRLEGHLAYISPEQTGRMNRAVDYRSDLYSLGVTLYQLLTGRPPFEATDPVSLVHGHIAVEPTPPHALRPQVPPALSDIVLKLLAKRAEDRYQSAYGLTEDLKECADRLRVEDSLDGFVPGRHDVSATFRIPEKLYGRDAEKAVLIGAFERASHGAATIVLVSGYSGVGKSALVSEIHKPIVARRGYYSSGKFDKHRNEPYGAFIQAFRELIRQILGEDARTVDRWRDRIREALGPNGRVVTDVVPEVALIVGPQPPVPDLGPSEAENRFNIVFQQFVRVFAREEHPLALFLDDLQWADSASLSLLSRLLHDTGSRNLFFVGAYRDNEVFESHPLMVVLDGLRKRGSVGGEIALKPLGLEHVRQLIVDTLGGDGEPQVDELAALVFNKTEGNPFFVNQFLTSLHARELVTFESETGRWRWSLERIRKEGITDNVAVLMAEKIRALAEPSQRVVELAACIGSTFALDTLATVSRLPAQVVAAELWPALEQGLLVPIGDAYKYVAPLRDDAHGPATGRAAVYSFLHDRVQEAAYSLIDPSARKAVHLRVGRLLMEHTPKEELDKRVFEIVDHLLVASELLETREERLQVAQLGLLAGTRARASAAYASGLRYLEASIGLLPEDGWERERELVHSLHRQRAECFYLLGQFDAAEADFERLLAHARTQLQKSELHSLRAALLISRGAFMAAAQAGREALLAAGIEIPTSGYEAAFVAELGVVGGLLQAKLAGRPVSSVQDFEEAREPEHRARILLVSRATMYAGDNLALYGLLAAIVVRLSLEHGNAAGSSIGYATYGMLHGGMTGDQATAYELGRVALVLAERFDEASTRATVSNFFGGYINPWRKHLREGKPHLERAFTGGMESGGILYAGFATMHASDQGFLGGEELHGLRERANRFADLLQRLNQKDTSTTLRGFERTFALLSSGVAPDDEELDAASLEKKLAHFPMNVATLLLLEMQAAYVLGDHAQALALGARTEPFVPMLVCNMRQTDYSFILPLAAAAAWASATPEEQARYRGVIDAQLKRLEQWAASCPENFEHRWLLVRAEDARICGREQEAMELYDQAIESATRHDFTNIQAMGNELAARFYLARGRRKLARAYLLDARYAYVRWGADAKVAKLDEEFKELLPRDGTEFPSAGGPTSASLDLMAIMNASQAISGELVLDELVRTLMRILIESAGAQRGFLILFGDSPLVVEAPSSGGQVHIHTTSVDDRDDLSTAVVRYVERTAARVVLGNAAQAVQFQADPYITRARPVSVLGMPILRQKKLVGVLYLENNLAAEAFTPERCKMLELLSAQAAISIENARLYDTLDNRVKERTRELRERHDELLQTLKRLKETQRQLVTQEKLASLGALTAGIAHELKNPLNFINNFAKLSVSAAVDLEEELQEAGVPTGRAVQEMLGTLKQNAVKIHEHGRRADKIINGMLLHSRSGSSSQVETDLNALLAESVNLAYHAVRGKEPEFHLELETAYDPTVGLVMLSASDVSRVFLNVIDNACYATREKLRRGVQGFVPKLSIRTKNLGHSVEVRIQDNGSGIPPEVVGRIFDPFFTTKPAGDGTGLGLSICYDIIQAHLGEIGVETVPGASTEFVITFPRRQTSLV